MTMQAYIRQNRASLCAAIRAKCSNLPRLTTEDIEEWIENDEGLYLSAKAAGVEV
jgi:hypothetical protein